MNAPATIVRRPSVCPHDCPSACALDVEVIDGARIAVQGFGNVGSAAAELFGSLTASPDYRPNLARWMLTDPAARHVLVDWEREAQGLLARLRAAAGRHPADPHFTKLVDGLHAVSPEVRNWWPRYDIQVSRGGTKRLRHPRFGVITLTHTAFHPAEQPEQTLVVYSGLAETPPLAR